MRGIQKRLLKYRNILYLDLGVSALYNFMELYAYDVNSCVCLLHLHKILLKNN